MSYGYLLYIFIRYKTIGSIDVSSFFIFFVFCFILFGLHFVNNLLFAHFNFCHFQIFHYSCSAGGCVRNDGPGVTFVTSVTIATLDSLGREAAKRRSGGAAGVFPASVRLENIGYNALCALQAKGSVSSAR